MSTFDETYLPGAAALIEQIDAKILLVLRDGRHLVGTLRSFDQYMNLVLEETVERYTFQGKYCEVPLGLFLVRGDNIVLLGEVEKAPDLQLVSSAELSEMLSKSQGNNTEWDFE